MGFRFRKSINLGGGFKINLSKHGVGYSWGTKGFRYTRKSTGGSRTTASIYGTGLSWVSETGGKKRKTSSVGGSTNSYTQPAHQHQAPSAQTYDTQNIENNVATAMVSEGLEDMLAMATKVLKTYKLIWIGFWVSLIFGCGFQLLWLVSAALLIYAFYYKKNNAISLEYTIDEEMRTAINERMSPLIRITQCKKVWRVTQTSKVVDKKYSSGAGNLIKRTECKTSTKATFPFATTEQIASFKADKETLLFLPDKLLIIQGSKIGALNYEDVKFSVSATRFIETEGVPSDTTVVGQTWEYVNKSGGPDKRFQNNRQLPICQYGELELKSATGLNTVLMFSNIINL